MAAQPDPPGDSELEQSRILARDHAALVADGAALESTPLTDNSPQSERQRECLRRLEQLRRHLADENPPPGATQLAEPAANAELLPTDGAGALAGARLGRFQVRCEVGRGAHGIVYQAFDPLLDRDVALKIPYPATLLSPDLQRRFRLESRTVAALHHPHLVPVYEVAEFGPVWCIVSQFCEGPTLAAWLERQTSSVAPEFAAELVAMLAETVDYVHGFGILHRDIKPANVLLESQPAVTPPAATRRQRPVLDVIPKLTDFGLAKLIGEPEAATVSGAIVGTPHYMSPEQAAGRTAEIGIATDVYALGAILYRMLAGRPPFEGQSNLETIRLVSEGSPPPIRRRDVARDLNAICMKCLETAPQRRYAAAGDLAADLRRYLAAQPVMAHRTGFVARAMKWARRKPVVAGLSLALFAALVCGFTAVVWEWRAAEGHRQKSDENFRLAQQAVRDFHDILFDGNTYDAPAFRPLRLELMRATIKYYEGFLAEKGDVPGLQANLADAYYHIGYLLHESKQIAEAQTWYDKALPLWEDLARQEPENVSYQLYLLRTSNQLGALHTSASRFADAQRHLEITIAVGQRLIDRDPANTGLLSDVANAYLNLAKAEADAGGERLDFALNHFLDAAQRRKEILKIMPDSDLELQRLGETWYGVGRVLLEKGRAAEALIELRRAEKIFADLVQGQKLSPKSEWLLANVLSFTGAAHQKLNDMESGIKCWKASCELFERLAKAHPQNTTYKVYFAQQGRDLAGVLFQQGDVAQALPMLDQALAQWEQLVADHPESTEFQFYLAAVLVQRAHSLPEPEQVELAQSLYLRAIALLDALVEAHPQTALYRQHLTDTLAALADLHFNAGQFEAALADIERALEHRQALVKATPHDDTHRARLEACAALRDTIRNQLASARSGRRAKDECK